MSATAPPRGAPLPQRSLWINGRVCRAEEALLSLFDRGARDGEGLYETLRVYGGRPFDWDRHMERLVLSAAELGFPVPASPGVLLDGLAALLEAERLADAVARFTVTRGVPGGRPTRTGAWIEVEPIAARLWSGARAGAAKAICSKRPFESGPLGRHKTTSRLAYALAREEARAARADEALLVRPEGEVLEGATSNVFAVLEGRLRTPPLTCGILPGTVRRRVLELCREMGEPVEEGAIERSRLATAEEAFVTNSVQEVVPIAVLDGRRLPSTALGERLQEAYRRLVS